jgi:hypothetical protein
LLRGALAGAAAAYFFDPDVGRRRRALVRDQLVHWYTVLRQDLSAELRDVSNRARGAAAAARRIGRPAPLTDDAIAGRIRTRLRSLEQPAGIRVDVRDGRVHLAGPVLVRDAERVRRIVRRIPGALELMDELEVHAMPDVPALRERQRNASEPATRLAIGLLTLAATAPIARRVGPVGTARTLAVCALGAAVANVERARLRAVEGSRGQRAAD